MTMNIYVLDKRNRPEGFNRDWTILLPISFAHVILESYENWIPARDDLVIVHLSDFQSRNGDGSPDPALATKLQTSQCLRLFISGSGSSQPIRSTDERGYVRCAPVDYPNDPVFGSRMALFLARLIASPPNTNPPWELTEPLAIPEHLVAISLLSLAMAQNRTIDSNLITKTLAGAKKEFQLLGGINTAFLNSTPSTIADIVSRPDVRAAIQRVLQTN